MKHIILTALAFFFLFGKMGAQGLVFQDTVFTASVTLTDELEFVTFQHCKFVNIPGDALTLNKTGAVISDCSFENIGGNGVVLDSSEVYLVNDTLRNISGDGVNALQSTVVVVGCQLSHITETSLYFLFCDLTEISDCAISDVGEGVFNIGQVESQISIESCSIRRVNGTPGQDGSGTAIWISQTGLLAIENSIIDSCMANGIYVNQAGSPDESVVIQGNTISRTNYYGIQGINSVKAIVRGNEISYPGFLGGFPLLDVNCISWSGPDVSIENNHLHHALAITGEPSSAISVLSSAKIVRNHIHDCAGSGIRYSNLANAGENPFLIFNNVIHDVGRNSIYYDGSGLPDTLTEPIQTIIRNNTLQSTLHGDPIQDALIAISSNENPVFVQGNILILDGEADTSVYLQALSGATITENLNLKASGDLGFVNYAGRDFHLASASSPAYNFLPLSFGLPNDDFEGTPRIGRHDAGAFELSSIDTICGCTNCPLGIPDLFFGDFIYSVGNIVNSDLASPAQGVCGVRVQFEHEYLGDLTMELISPAGQSVQLVGPTGFFGATDNNNWDIGFTTCDGIASPDPGFSATWNSNQNWGTSGVYTGVYQPANGCLEDFNTGNVIGDWTLRVFDNQVQDTGVVYKFEMMFCDMAGISCQPCSNPPQANFTAVPFGDWEIVLQNQTTGGTSQFQIDFGDGATAIGHAIPNVHTYTDTGTFLIQLIAINDCGIDSFTQSVHIQGALPVVFVSAEPTTGCAPLEVHLGATLANNVDHWHWICPGGVPEESIDAAPIIQYSDPGNYLVSVIVSNALGSDTLENVISIDVLPGLINPSFSIEVQGDSIICTNTTQNAESLSFFWTLNNDDPVGLNTSPQIFVVDTSGSYSVGLTVASNCDFIEVFHTVTVLISGTNNLENAGWQFALSPNPNDGRFDLNIHSPENAGGQLSVLNALGEQIYTETIRTVEGQNVYPVQLGELPSGLYHLHVWTERGAAVLRFVVR